jgi:hypothetical protein
VGARGAVAWWKATSPPTGTALELPQSPGVEPSPGTHWTLWSQVVSAPEFSCTGARVRDALHHLSKSPPVELVTWSSSRQFAARFPLSSPFARDRVLACLVSKGCSLASRPPSHRNFSALVFFYCLALLFVLFCFPPLSTLPPFIPTCPL